MSGRISSIEVTSRSGQVTIRAADVQEPTITKGAGTIDDRGVVSTPGHTSIEVTCPVGTDVVVGARSGSVRCTGALGRVAITTRAGAVEIEDATSIDVRTRSSTVTIGRCAGTCAVVTKSGRVRIGAAAEVTATSMSGRIDIGFARDATVRSAAGDVHIDASGDGRVLVQTVSASVEIELPTVADPVTTLTSRSGSVKADRIEADRVAADRVDPRRPGTGAVDVETVSGSIAVRHR
ncbi:MAG: DUF4097 family beta strand repeat-containing protein [Acidimicrobiia bacterium]